MTLEAGNSSSAEAAAKAHQAEVQRQREQQRQRELQQQRAAAKQRRMAQEAQALHAAAAKKPAHAAVGAEFLSNASLSKDKSITFAPEAAKPGDKPSQPTSSSAAGSVEKNAQGQVSKVTYSNGKSAQFGYDSSGQVDQVTRPDGSVDKLVNGQWVTSPGGVGTAGDVGAVTAGGFGQSGKSTTSDSSTKSDKASTDASKSSQQSAPTEIPADMSNVKVSADGTWSYSTKEGSQFTNHSDGTTGVNNPGSSSKAEIGLTGQPTSVTINGESYTTSKGAWVDSLGKPAGVSNFQVQPDGSINYQDTNSNNFIALAPNGSKTTTDSTGVSVTSNKAGQVQEVSNFGDYSSFTYSSNGSVASYTDSSGASYKAQPDGSLQDAKGNKITNLQVSQNGDLSYINGQNKLVTSVGGSDPFTSAESVQPGTVAKNSDGSTVTANPDGSTVSTNGQSDVTSVKYKDGSSRQFSYDQSGQLSGFTYSSDGQSSTYKMVAGQWKSQSGQDAGFSNVSVDSRGDFSSSPQDGTGQKVTVLTDNSQISSHSSGFSVETNSQGTPVQYTDTRGNVYTSEKGVFKDSAGDTLTPVNNNTAAGSHMPAETDSNGNNYLVKNSSGQLVENIYSNGQSRQFGYGTDGKVNSITQPDGTTDKLINGQWMTNGSVQKQALEQANALGGLGSVAQMGAASGHAEAPKGDSSSWVPAGVSNVQLSGDGSLSYKTSSGDQVSVLGDGSSTRVTSNGTSVDSDVNGHVNSIIGNGGKVDTFNYGTNGQLDGVSLNGTSYSQNAQGVWEGANGKPSSLTNFSVDSTGNLSYKDTQTQQTTRQFSDGTEQVAYTDGSSITKNAAGQIISVAPSQGSSDMVQSAGNAAKAAADNSPPAAQQTSTGTMTFAYDSSGHLKQFTAGGDSYQAQSNGTFTDKAGNVISNAQVGQDGNLTYQNSTGHVVLASRSGTISTSSETAAQLQQKSAAIHQSELVCTTSPDNNVSAQLNGLNTADLVALQQQYSGSYHSDLSTDLAKNIGQAAEPDVQKLFTANLQSVGGTSATKPETDGNGQTDDSGQQLQYQLQMASKLGLPQSDAVTASLATTALASSDKSITASGIDQTKYGDCWFESSLSALAQSKGGPEAIKNMVKVNSDGSYTVTFPESANSNGKPTSVNVSQAELATYGTGDSTLWANVAETAALKLDQANTQTGNVPGANYGYHDGMGVLTTHSVQADPADSTSSSTIQKALASGSPVTAWTTKEPVNSPIVGGHAFTVVSCSDGYITLRNPWGTNGQGGALATPGQTIDGVTDEGNGLIKMPYSTFAKQYYQVDIG